MRVRDPAQLTGLRVAVAFLAGLAAGLVGGLLRPVRRTGTGASTGETPRTDRTQVV